MENERKKVLTLCIVHQHPKVLLGMKKRGFGMGRWNGFGGKVEADETIEAAAARELMEEAGVRPLAMTKVGVLDFRFENDPVMLEVHVFGVTEFNGDPKESEEMKPQWFFIDEIPFSQMWPDDLYWMPLFLSGKKFKGEFLFDGPVSAEHSARIMSKKLYEVKEV